MRANAARVAAAFAFIVVFALCGASRAAQPWPHGDPDAVIRTVLAQPAYRALKTTDVKPQETLLDAIIRRIGDFLRWIFGSLTAALKGAQTAGAAFGIALIIALIALLIVVIARVATVLSRRRRAQAASVWVQSAPLGGRSASEWLTAARSAAQRGDYAAGVAAVFNAALHRLDERGVVAFDDARTPAEYRALLRRTPGAPVAPFDRIARRFVVASFSQSPTGAADFAEASDAYATLDAEPR